RLEDVFTVFTGRANGDFRVISHAEQLAKSVCARESAGRLWCGTCHDPHPAAPVNYNSRCRGCHAGSLSATHRAGESCTACHMTRREARDGAHTVFTDHRILRRPQAETASAGDELTPWRAPEMSLLTRNLAIAYVETGVSGRSPAQIVRGYRM